MYFMIWHGKALGFFLQATHYLDMNYNVPNSEDVKLSHY